LFNVGPSEHSSIKFAIAEEEDFELESDSKEIDRLRTHSGIEDDVNGKKSTQIKEENEMLTRKDLDSKRKSSSKEKKLAKSAPSCTIPLNPMDRNSSQIFYAQSQANALCLEDDVNETKAKNTKKSSNC
jgi:hypothetical protein